MLRELLWGWVQARTQLFRLGFLMAAVTVLWLFAFRGPAPLGYLVLGVGLIGLGVAAGMRAVLAAGRRERVEMGQVLAFANRRAWSVLPLSALLLWPLMLLNEAGRWLWVLFLRPDIFFSRSIHSPAFLAFVLLALCAVVLFCALPVAVFEKLAPLRAIARGFRLALQGPKIVVSMLGLTLLLSTVALVAANLMLPLAMVPWNATEGGAGMGVLSALLWLAVFWVASLAPQFWIAAASVTYLRLAGADALASDLAYTPPDEMADI